MEDIAQDTLSCQGCGANIPYSARDDALTCEYCHTVTTIDRPRQQRDDVPRLVIPFTVDQDAFEVAVYTLLAFDDLAPEDLPARMAVSRFERFYAPAYLYPGSPRTIAYAGSRATGNAVALVEQCAGKAVDHEPSLIGDLEVEPFAAGKEAVFAQRAQDGRHVSGEMVEHSVPVLVPVCHVAYEYQGRRYHIWIDGTDVKKVAADPLPRDERRRKKLDRGDLPWFVTFLLLMPAGVLSDTPGPFNAVSAKTLGIIAAAAVFSFVRKQVILWRSRNVRMAVLAAKITKGRKGGAGRQAWVLPEAVDKLLVLLVTAGFCVWLWQARPNPSLSTPADRVDPVATLAQAPKTFGGTEPLAPILEAAGMGDWRTIDFKAGLLAEKAPPVHGDSALAGAALQEGEAALRKKDPGAAIAAFERAVQGDPAGLEARDRLAAAYLQAKEFDKAAAACASALAIAPRHVPAWVLLAEPLAQAGQNSRALASLRIALRFSPNRTKLLPELKRLAKSHENKLMRAAAAQALKEAPGITY